MEVRRFDKAMKVEIDALREQKRIGCVNDYGVSNNVYYWIQYKDGEYAVVDAFNLAMNDNKLPCLDQRKIDYIHAWFEAYGLVCKGNVSIYYDNHEEEKEAFKILGIEE